MPAWRAASVDVAETMRGRGTGLTAGAARRGGTAIAVLAGLAVAAIVAQRAFAAPAAGLAASAALVALTGVLARPLVALAARVAARWPLPGVGPVGHLALRMLRHDLRRAALAVAMVGIGVGTVVWLALVAFSFERTAVRVFEQAMRADYVVSSAHTGAGALEMPVDDALADTLRGVDGVGAVIGVRLANWQHQGESVVLDAFDPEYFRNPAYGQWPLHGERVEGAWEAVADGRAVVVSSNFAQNMARRRRRHGHARHAARAAAAARRRHHHGLRLAARHDRDEPRALSHALGRRPRDPLLRAGHRRARRRSRRCAAACSNGWRRSAAPGG